MSPDKPFVVRVLRGNLQSSPLNPGQKLTGIDARLEESFATLVAALDHAKGLLSTCKLEIVGPGLHWDHNRVRDEVNARLP